MCKVSTSQEFKISNEAGAFVHTSGSFCNTKTYHGVFGCPINDDLKTPHILLSSLDETVVLGNCSYQLGYHKYQDTFHPDGINYICHHEPYPVFTTIYCMGPIVLKKQIILLKKENRLCIRYKVQETIKPIKLQLMPLTAFREIFKTSKANENADKRIIRIEDGIKHKLYQNYPELYMQLSANSKFVYQPDWYYNFEYYDKKNTFHEDLFSPGYFEITLNHNEQTFFTTALTQINTNKLESIFNSVETKQSHKSQFYELASQN